MLNGIEAQSMVVEAGGQFWTSVKEWGAAREILTPTETDILEVAASMPARLPTEKQSVRALEALRRLHGEGFQGGKELV